MPQQPGFRIFPSRDKRRDLVALFQDLPTAVISDNMSRMTGTSDLTPYHRPRQLLGVAFTVRTRSGDNLMLHKALALLQPGDVLVVDGGGATDRALMGEIMKQIATQRGAAGFVIDGLIRDVAAFRADTFPCYARGVSHRGPYKDGPGEIEVPVSVAGMVVNPGDLIVGDEDGLVAVSPADAEAVAQAARTQVARERSTLEAIANHSYDASWIDKMLKAKGVDVG